MLKASSPFDSDNNLKPLVDAFRQSTGVEQFDLAVVLGSGWHNAAAIGTLLGSFEYSDWPCFPTGQISGHHGRLIAVRQSPWNILFFSGRFHCYQGLTAYEASLPVRLAAAFGCRKVLLTCATGGINKNFKPGDFMLVDDHLNFMADNPLRGLVGDTFVDLSDVYEHRLYDQLLTVETSPMTIHRGVLSAMAGPSYETPAEVRFLATSGADVVSMSTVPEAIMARYLQMKVAAVAFISNYAAGMSAEKLNHKDVLACSSMNSENFAELTQMIVNSWQHLDDLNSD